MKKNNILVFSLIFLFVIVAPFAFGANILDTVFQPFHGLNIGSTYKNYAAFIDAVIYFWFFIALTKGIFKDKFPSAVAITIGIMLGIGMGVFEYTSHFNLGMLAPFAALIFFLVLGTMLFMWTKSLGDNGLLAFSLTFLIIYGLVYTVAESLVKWIQKVPFLSAILGIALIIAIIGLIVGVFRLFGNIGSGASRERRLENTERDNIRNEQREKDDELKALKKTEKAQEKVAQLDRDMDRLRTTLSNVEGLEKKYLEKDMLDRTEQIDVLKKLIPILQKAYQAQQQLTGIYSKINKPEYDISKDEVMNAATELDTLIQQIDTMLQKLDDSIKNSDKSDTAFVKTAEEFKNEFAKIVEGDINELKDIDEALEAIRKIDEEEYLKIYEVVKKANASSGDLFTIRENIKANDEKLRDISVNIKKLDDKNILDIDRAITSLRSDVEKSTGLINNSLNTLIKGTPKADIMDIRAREGKLAGAMEILRQGRKYFSASSLRQTYITVSDIYRTMSSELIPLISERNKLITDKMTEVSKYTKMDAAAITDMKKAFNTELTNSNTNFKNDRDKLVVSLATVNSDTDNIVKSLKAPNHMDKTVKPGIMANIENEMKKCSDTIVNKTDYTGSYKFKIQKLLKVHSKQIAWIFNTLENLHANYNDANCTKVAADLSNLKAAINTIDTDTQNLLNEYNKIKLFTITVAPTPTP